MAAAPRPVSRGRLPHRAREGVGRWCCRGKSADTWSGWCQWLDWSGGGPESPHSGDPPPTWRCASVNSSSCAASSGSWPNGPPPYLKRPRIRFRRRRTTSGQGVQSAPWCARASLWPGSHPWPAVAWPPRTRRTSWGGRAG